MTSRRLPLNTFLLRAGKTPLEAFSGTLDYDLDLFRYVDGGLEPLPDPPPLVAAGAIWLALLSRATAPPVWQAFIRDEFGVVAFGAGAGRSLGAVVFTSAADPEDGVLRWVAWTFGSGSRALRRGAIDPRFGLVVALNEVAGEQQGPGRLRQLQYRTPSPYTQHTDHRAARDIPVDGFRVDRMLDIVSGVGGRTEGGAGQVFGSRSLRWRAEVDTANSLVALAEVALARYRERTYQEAFAWVDHYVLVEDEGRTQALREELFGLLIGEGELVDVLLPDDLLPPDDERAINFIVYPGERRASASRTVLTADMLADRFRDAGPSGLDEVLRFLDVQREQIGVATVLECLAAEFEFDAARYVAYEGDFYSVDGSFLDQINVEVSAIPTATVQLPCYSGGSEGVWNRAVASDAPGHFACIDGEFIRLPGTTAFEACDLVTTDAALICAKRKGRSSTMTYVFTQATKSCRVLVSEEEARRQLDDLVSAAATDDAARSSMLDSLGSLTRRPPDNEVVFALLGDWRNRGVTHLPLLTKISLLEAARDLQLMGFRPTVALVGLCSRE